MNVAVPETELTLPGLLRFHAQRTPQAPAVHHGTETLSYSDLDGMAAVVARRLVELGVQPGERVGVLFANQPEWLAATFGALAVGAVVVPLNTWYKDVELEWTLRHCGVSVLLSMDALNRQNYADTLSRILPELVSSTHRERLSSPRFPELRTVVMSGRAPKAAIPWATFMAGRADMTAGSDPAPGPSPEIPAFILYTSGSTAEPKGVVLEHRNIIENGAAIGDRRLIVPSDVIWLGSPLFYGLGAANALPVALAHGASLLLQDSFDAGRALDEMQRRRPTVYYGTGNMTQALLEHSAFSRSRVASLERGTAGLSPHHKRLAIVELGITGATPAYGLTESYGHATGGRPDDPLEVKLHTDGEPLPGHEFLVVDTESGEPVTDGHVGKILLRGRVTPAYYANPHETAKAIGPDGWFDTGDLGRFDDHGRLIFDTRLKEVIKSGGINVSPGEVERIIAAHPDVREAYVVGVPHARRGEVVVAIVVATGTVSEADIQDFVRERAASFKTPQHVLFRSPHQLSRLASGKVAKRVLEADARRELGNGLES